MRDWLVRSVLIIVLFWVLAKQARADYVLPYPSYMPGHSLYRLARLFDQAKKWWYWGSIAQVKYHLSLSDKYLVEAKTLFEYKQYLLAVEALDRSNKESQALLPNLAKAQAEGKDVSRLQLTIKEAMQTHLSTLRQLQQTLPAEFNWQPERQAPTYLNLRQLLDKAITLRSEIISSW